MVKKWQVDFRKMVYDFLQENAGKKFTINKMYKILKEQRTDITFSYGTILLWTNWLIASKKINCEDLKMVKFVWVDKNESTEG